MGTSTITHRPGQLDAAAAAVATAALVQSDPLLAFSVADPRQLGAHEAGDKVTVYAYEASAAARTTCAISSAISATE
jgi:hypothetical protein